ncbi:CatB-related O-acetyltransferase [Nocardioides seonyuensis]|uniref:CatB-related O-acetyltransferase n=1 Tax=Nocardioides seonyuensis TaxID=2518371 RepID=A0A4P7IC17_9ACTN|nr:CatB-related O-acetyltransferase [Nocardioides seonyuensis]QBX54628.1 CatB-related O-acetyltransferase [Nocardioides seonyuensis]
MKRRILLPTARRLDERPDLAQFEIGRYSWGHLTVANRNPGCVLKVGQFCSFAFGTEVFLGGEHRTDYVTTYRFGSYPPFNETYASAHAHSAGARGDITIGNDVWIGHRAMILSGVTLGDGVVVGAGSVVRQSAPPYAIVAGNPARVAGFRFPPEQIEAMLRIKWWDWSEDRIVAALDLLMSEDIQSFIDAYDVAVEDSPLPQQQGSASNDGSTSG